MSNYFFIYFFVDNEKNIIYNYSMITLRPYQTKTINEARELMRQGIKSILIQSPTGSGKTILTAHMLKSAAEKDMPSLFIVHRRELIKQSTAAFSSVGVRHGIIANGFCPDIFPMVQIASIGSLAKRVDKIRKPRLIIWDEAHHCAAAGWSKIHAQFPDAFHIGLTATPQRLDGTGLGKWFKRIINGPSVQWLIDNGFLSKYTIFAPSSINTSGIHTSMGDFNKGELNAACDKPSITGDAIKHYMKLAAGKRAVVFCVSIEHSKHVVEQFKSAGISAAHVDGETEMGERDEKIDQFRKGNIKVLANVDLFGEGFDLPSLEVSILLRPTQSLGLFLQQCGRCLRKSDGKLFAVILDHAGNVARHGLPCEDRSWSLEGEAKGTKGSKPKEVSIKICEKCFAAQSSVRHSCIICGFEFPVEGRKIASKEGDLVEINPDAIREHRIQEQGMAKTLADLVKIGTARGYKRPYLWAKYVFNGRQVKRNAGG